LDVFRKLAVSFNVLILGSNEEHLENETGIVFLANFDYFDSDLQLHLIANAALLIGSVSGTTHLTSITQTPCLVFDVVTLESSATSCKSRFVFKTLASSIDDTPISFDPYMMIIGYKHYMHPDTVSHPLTELGYNFVRVEPEFLLLCITDFLQDLGEISDMSPNQQRPWKASLDTKLSERLLEYKNRFHELGICVPYPHEIYYDTTK